MTYLTTSAGKKVYFEDYGSGDSAIVLVHGWGMSCRTWDYTLPTLINSNIRTVTLDHRGCGKSDKDFADQGIQAIAGDVVALVEHLGLQQVVLNGWSLGGAVVVTAAQQLGERCIGLVLTCGATPCYVQKDEYPHGGTDSALRDTLDAMKKDRVPFLAGLSAGVFATEVPQSVVDWMWSIFLEASPQAATALGQLGPLDQREVIGELTMPILSFVGAKDMVVDPNVCRSVADYNSGVTLVECADSGHAPFIEEYDLYHDELISFVTALV